MSNLYSKVESIFEKLSMFITAVLGNSITFIVAVLLVGIYFTDPAVYVQPRHRIIMDMIFATTFLSLFVIQKTMNHFSKALHIKINELVAAQDTASNKLINVEEKSEAELKELADHFSRLAKQSAAKEGSQSIDKIIGQDQV